MVKRTENNLLGLRKNQIEDYIMSKRKVIVNENSLYQINPLTLSLQEEHLIDIPVFIQNVFITTIYNNFSLTWSS